MAKEQKREEAEEYLKSLGYTLNAIENPNDRNLPDGSMDLVELMVGFSKQSQSEEVADYRKCKEIIKASGTTEAYKLMADKIKLSTQIKVLLEELEIESKEVERLREENKDSFKKVATSFFYWWYNKGGTNTDEGFEEFWKQQALKQE